jgi:hypothetical protein
MIPGWCPSPAPDCLGVSRHSPDIPAIPEPVLEPRRHPDGARCRWRPDGPDRNAVLYDADGKAVSEHVLGDGVAHVLATSTGQVWRAEPAGEYRVVLPHGEPLPQGTRVIGRGSRLHFLTGTSWYQLDVDDIPA